MRRILLTALRIRRFVPAPLRRIGKKVLKFKGLPITSSAALEGILEKGWDLVREGEHLILKTPYGLLVGRSLEDFFPMVNEVEELYSGPDVKGRTVLDVGALNGDTALFFTARGASLVHALEPFFHDLLRKTVELNKLYDKIIAHPHGVWWRDGIIRAEITSAGTGLKFGPAEARVRSLSSVLKEARPDLVKMDCEGCEYSLLLTPCEDLRTAREWIIEIHGPETPVVERMIECGFSISEKHVLRDLVSVIIFTAESSAP